MAMGTGDAGRVGKSTLRAGFSILLQLVVGLNLTNGTVVL